MGHPATRPEARRGRPSLVDAAFREHRNTITALYCDENKSLPDTMELMKSQHGFSATIKQYKDRLTLWKLSKNIRHHEMSHLARIKVQRDAVGKKTRLKLRGAAVDSSKVDRWIRTQRKKMGDDDFMLSFGIDASTPPDIGYETPDNDDDDTSPSQPGTLSPRSNDSFASAPPSSPVPCPPAKLKSFRLIENFSDSPSLVRYIDLDHWGLPAAVEKRGPGQNGNGDLLNPIFEVSVSPLQLSFKVFSQGLLSDLRTVLPSSSYQIDESFDGTPLLEHFSRINAHLHMLECGGLPGSDRTAELALLVDGCLGNLAVYRSFGRPYLQGGFILDEELRRMLEGQELDDSIDTFDQAFLAIDNNEQYNARAAEEFWTFSTEEEASQTWKPEFYDLPSHEQLALREKFKAAIRLGDVDTVRDCMSQVCTSPEGGFDWLRPPEPGVGWLRPLMIDACSYGHESIVQLFLQCGAEVNWKLGSRLSGTAPNVECNENTTTPIIEASKSGHLRVVEMLLATLHAEVQDSTWLHGAFVAALRYGKLEIAKRLSYKVFKRAELLACLMETGDEALLKQACEFLHLWPTLAVLEPECTAGVLGARICQSTKDWYVSWLGPRIDPVFQLPSFRKFQRGKFLDFRLNFIHQHSLLRLAAASSPIFEHLAMPLYSYRDMWDTAMVTMSEVGRGRLPETDAAAIAVVCISRALAETATHNGSACLGAFQEDLSNWARIFPVVGEVADIMWGTSTSLHYPDNRLFQEQVATLRNSTLALIEKATQLFALRSFNLSKDVNGHPRQRRSGTNPGENTTPVRTEEPLDRPILPEATGHEGDQGAIDDLPLVSPLIAGIIFALVVLFLLAFSRPTSSTVLGFPSKPLVCGCISDTVNRPRGKTSAIAGP